MRLTLVIYSLGPGGAERVMSIMANHFVMRGDDVSIVTFDDGGERPFYELDPRVGWQPLGTACVSGSMLARFRNAPARIMALRKQIQANDPGAIVSFMDRTNLLTLAATIGMRTPVIVSERNDPSQHNVSAFSGALRTILYRRAKTIVVQTNAAAAYFGGSLRARTLVIPNPIPVPASGASNRVREGKAIVAMGRLTHAKGFDLLLPAFASLAGRFPDWNLTIWGDGELRTSLEALRDAVGLAGRVRMPGKTKDPAGEMKAADIFVLSSRYEGFPNVLAEAMANGAAVVAFDCPSGPAAMISSGCNGLLIPPQNVAALAEAMAGLMTNEPERRRLGANAVRIAETFSLERVMSRWETVIGTQGFINQGCD